MNRSVIFKKLIDIYKAQNNEIKNRLKDNYFHFDDDITNVEKNQKLGNHR
ncbi:hypothetical protein [Brassicibacter mesophilus]